MMNETERKTLEQQEKTAEQPQGKKPEQSEKAVEQQPEQVAVQSEKAAEQQPEKMAEQQKKESAQTGETERLQTGEKTPEQTKNAAGKTGVKKRRFTKSVLFPIFLTVLLLAAFYTARIVYFCAQYPQETVSIETLCGENGEGLDQLSYDGTKFYAESTRPTITLDLENGGPIRCIGFGVRNLSRENCWSYITIERARGGMERGSVIMAEGSNAIDFEDVTPQDEVTRIVFMPVPVRGVSFSLTSFTINPRSHIIGTELLNFLVLLSVAVMFEAVVLAMLRENRRVGFPHLWTVMLAAILQMFLGYLFISQYFTDAWAAYDTFYHFAVFLSEGAFLLLLHLPSYSTAPRADHASAAGNGGGSILVTKDRFTGGRPLPHKHEMVLLRTLLLSIFSFSLLELLYSDMFRLDDMESWWLNILVYAVPFLVLYAVWGRHKRHWSYGVGLIWWLFAAMVNHYYFQYRAQAIEFSDLSMAGTAKNVMNGGYHLTVTQDVLFVYVAFALMLIGINTEACRGLPAKKWWNRLAAASAAAGCVLIVAENLPVVNLWNTNIATLHHGYALSFFSFMEKSLEKPTPAGYSAAEAEQILAKYAAADSSAPSDTGTGLASPNVIVVMDEAFADLPTVYGFDTDVDDLPFIHSLEGSNVRKGWMLSSVFGGTTANTEYEFLTGNSTAFLNGGSVPYTQYINSRQESLAWMLKNRGYQTTAFHPYLASGYKRYKVYPLLGFDTFHSSEDGLMYDDKIRTFISDSSDFKDLEHIFEQNDDGKTPQFIFNVTMQNHGNYNADTPAVDVTVKPTDGKLASLAQLEEYLALAHATDQAFEELLTYFAQVKEPTIILMFGDHQPGLNEETLRTICPEMYEDGAALSVLEKKYTVPYIMWANFDLTSEELKFTSPNFLRSYLLENAGIGGSAYDRFTAAVRREYPAINILGYSDAAGELHSVSELGQEPLLSDYRKVAYYNLFDHGRVKKSLFE